MQEQNEKFDKEIAAIKKKKGKTKIIEFKNTITELKNLVESLRSRLDHVEERTCDLERICDHRKSPS